MSRATCRLRAGQRHRASVLLFGISWMLVRSRIRAERASKDLEEANRELEGPTGSSRRSLISVSHDLRAPLRAIDGFSQILQEDYEHALDDEGMDYLGRVRAASGRMGTLIDDLLDLSRVGRRPLRREHVDLTHLATEIVEELKESQPNREVEFVAAENILAWGDASLLKLALENLLGNAWKFTARERAARIEFGAERRPGPDSASPSTTCGTTGPASTRRTQTSSSARSRGCTGRMSSRGRG